MVSIEVRTVTDEQACALQPVVPDDANKYTRGMAELVVGSPAYPGAAVLAAAAADMAGAGYVKVYSCPEVAQALRVEQPSAVVDSREDFFRTHRAPDPYAEVADDGLRARKPSAVLVGSGMPVDYQTKQDVLDVLERAKAPVVLDGGAFAALRGYRAQQLLEYRQRHGLATIITPHGGEAARLARYAGIDASSFDAAAADCPDPGKPQLACALADAYKAVCVLKGPNTYIVEPLEDSAASRIVWLMDEGTPDLAKAGTGDLLAGLMTGYLAQGMPALDAAILAVWDHAHTEW